MNGNLETDNCFYRDSAYEHVWHSGLGWQGETPFGGSVFYAKMQCPEWASNHGFETLTRF